MLDRNNLHGYQHRVVAFIKDKKRCALFLDMGLGKSIASLTAVADLSDDFSVTKTLVIAPLRVANSVWKQEAENWKHTRHLKVRICTGSTKNRLANLQRSADIYVINRENVTWLVELYGKRWPFDCVVVDESSSFKSASSKRFKSLKKIIPYTNYMVLLTGTPSPNGLLDLWSQVYLVDFGVSLGRTMTNYKRRFFESDFRGYAWTPKAGSDRKIHKAIEGFTISMTADDYLELPERINLTSLVDLPEGAKNVYATMKEEFFAELGDGETLEAVSAGVLANKLLQIANGFAYTDELKNWTGLHSVKLDALSDIVDENADENLLVAYNYKVDLERLQERFPTAVVLDKEQSTLDRWNRGEIKMLLAHPACLDGDTGVLTEHSGWVKMTDVKFTDKVFDGIEFVSHDGCQYSGHKAVIDVFGIDMTADHKLLINQNWIEAQDVRASRQESSYRYHGDDPYLSTMLQVPNRVCNGVPKFQKAQQAWRYSLQGLYKRYFSQHDQVSNLEHLEGNEGSFSGFIRQRLWWARDYIGRSLDGLSRILQGYGVYISGQLVDRTCGCEWGVQQGELYMDPHERSAEKQKNDSLCGLQRGDNSLSRAGTGEWFEQVCIDGEVEQRDEWGRGRSERDGINLRGRGSVQHPHKKINTKDVYDLVNCGKRNRFLIRNKLGEVFVSHNSAGHGLNLQKGGSIVVWFGLNWSLELYQQFNARLHRQGQDNVVRIVHIVANDTIDQRVLETLGQKDATQRSLIDALKRK